MDLILLAAAFIVGGVLGLGFGLMKGYRMAGTLVGDLLTALEEDVMSHALNTDERAIVEKLFRVIKNLLQ